MLLVVGCGLLIVVDCWCCWLVVGCVGRVGVVCWLVDVLVVVLCGVVVVWLWLWVVVVVLVVGALVAGCGVWCVGVSGCGVVVV